MNSEKVKEIKKALECCKQNEIEDTCAYCSKCPASDWDVEKECNIDLFQKTLTLIDELESENEKWQKDCADIANDYQEMGKFYYEEVEKNQKLKDRIAEFDNLVATIYVAIENARKETKEAEEYAKRELCTLFTSFAERVKMEFYHEFDEIISSIMSDKIDNILKEILGK